MKHFNILVGLLVVFMSCQNIKKEQQDKNPAKEQVVYATFGAKMDTSAVKSDREIADLYHQLGESDSVNTKFKATVTEVCQAKGCWMKLQLGDGKEAMVRFKDYGFFVPKDIAGEEVIVAGNAFVDQMSVEDQRHYAEDEGKTVEEIAQITEPKKTYSFEATGVLIKKEVEAQGN